MEKTVRAHRDPDVQACAESLQVPTQVGPKYPVNRAMLAAPILDGASELLPDWGAVNVNVPPT